jgi:hypothetical protein
MLISLENMGKLKSYSAPLMPLKKLHESSRKSVISAGSSPIFKVQRADSDPFEKTVAHEPGVGH